MFCIHPPAHVTVYKETTSDIYVYNPSTREFLSLPALPNPPSKTWPTINCNLIFYNFGFDPARKEYKIVGILCKISNPHLRVVAEVECGIFIVGGNSWRTVNLPIPVSFKPSTPGVCVNGAIHWLVNEERVILAFDLGDEVFRVIRLTDGMTTVLDQDDGDGDDEYENDDSEDEYKEEISSCVWPCLIHVGSYLAVLEYDDGELRMWVLKDYQNQQWVLQSMDYPYDWNLMNAMAYGSSHTGKFFLSLDHNVGSPMPKIVCCDMEGSTYRRIRFIEQFEKIDPNAAMLSLVGCYPENIMPLLNI